MNAPAPRIAFRLLGPLEVEVDGRLLPVGGLRPRAVLAMLLVAAGTSVSEDALIDALWGEDPPRESRNGLQSHVARLRAALAQARGADLAGRLRRDGAGYRFLAGPGEVDVTRVEALVARARALRAGTAEPQRHPSAAAARLLDEALACWRGPALAEFANLAGGHSSRLASARVGLDELESTVRDERLRARLDAGWHAESVPQLEELAAGQPLRESSHRLLALALYRCGRSTDALAVLRRYRARLVDEVGLDPSTELAELERAILSADPALAAPVPAAPVPGPPPAVPGPPQPPAVPAHLRSAAPFVGRDEELDRLGSTLRESRLVTITGPGGVGKTRLALQVLVAGIGPAGSEPGAAPDGAAVLELAPLHRGDAVVPALAAVLGVRAGPAQSLDEAVVDYLSTQRMLLLVDNCEHLRSEAAAVLHHVVVHAPGVTVLATSRERLGVAGEQVFPLDPLPLPPAPGTTERAHRRGGAAEPAETASVRLFLDRARRSRPTFALTDGNRPIVEEICRRLDGLPLAIELAAGRLAGLGLLDLRDRLDDRLDLLADGARAGADADAARHATLRAVVDWSYALVGEAQRRLWERLSVFDGGFTLDAAEWIAGDAGRPGAARTLAALVDASLVTATESEDGRLRYSVLETLRAYAAQRLRERGEREDAVRRHAAWVVAFAESAERGLEGADEAAWVRRVAVEFANVRSAWHGCLDSGDLQTAARITVALTTYAQWRGRVEPWSWARRLAERDDPMAQRPAVLGAAAIAAYLRGDLAEIERLATAGLAAAGRGGAGDGGPSAAGGPAPRAWWCVVGMHLLAMYRGAYERAEELARQAFEAADLPTWRVILLGNVVLARLYRGDVDAARAAVAACHRAAAGGSRTGQAWAGYVDGEVAIVDDPDRAIGILQDAVAVAHSAEATFVEGVATVGLVSVATRAGDHRLALQRFPDAIRHWQRSGMWVQQWTTLRVLAELLANVGEAEPAAVLLAAADAAPDAPAVVGADAERLRSLSAALSARLGAEAFARAATRASALSRPELLDYAIGQIHDATA